MKPAPPTVRFVQARAAMREWLADLALLERRVNAVDSQWQAFNDAWKMALEGAAKAAYEYTQALKEMMNGDGA